jgi:hypothetical protein
VNFGDIIVGVFAFRNATLVGDEDDQVTVLVQCFQGSDHGGQNVKLAQAAGVITRVMIDYAIAIKKNGFLLHFVQFFGSRA